MSSDEPNWWRDARKDIDDAMHAFTKEFEEKLLAKTESQIALMVKRKNPFLFRIRAAEGLEKFVDLVLAAHVSSSEETAFGNALEKIVIAICSRTKDGRKSSTAKVDLEYDVGAKRTMIAIKSGPHWANSSQKDALKSAFKTASIVVQQGGLTPRCVEGCCYVKSSTKNLGTHFKIVGRDFWKEISGFDGTDRLVMDAIGGHAGNGLDYAMNEVRSRMGDYLVDNGITDHKHILWDRLLDVVM